MKRSLKKAVAFILSLVLVTQLFVFKAPSAHVYASELSDFEISEDGTAIYGYYGTDDDIVIPADCGIEMVSLYMYGTEKTLTVPEGVSEVYVSSESLEKITLPSTVSYLSLSYCTSLTEIDMSKMDGTLTYGNYEIWDCPKLSTIRTGKLIGSLDLFNIDGLTALDVSGTTLDYLYLYNITNLKEIKVNQNISNVSLYSLPSLKSVSIPRNATVSLGNLNFDAVTIKNNNYGYSIKDGCLYHAYHDDYYNDDIIALDAIDFNRKVINVKKGTKVINNLNLSGNYYKTEVINLPDSVEMFNHYAFDGGDNLKSFTFPKNLISLESYCFSGFNPDIELVIPASVTHVDYDAFSDFKGHVNIEKETPSLSTYEDGIYYYYTNTETGERISDLAWLVYYPKDKETIEFSPDTTYIAPNIFQNSSVKSLEIPEGVMWLDLYLSKANNLTSISIPASVYYIYRPMLIYAPVLKEVKVSPDNEYYTAYQNCLYNKDMTALIDVPGALKEIEIPEGVISLNYYTISNHFAGYGEDEEMIKPEVDFPSTVEEFDYSLTFGSASVYADTPVARYIVESNAEYQYWADEYGYEAELIDYTLKDSVTDLLDMIYVVDTVNVKKGKKTTVSADMPAGVNAVSKLTLGNNTECKVKFSSSDKSIATVNSKTGVVKGKKKGTCTINVKCTFKVGKKTTSKTFKIKLKVK